MATNYVTCPNCSAQNTNLNAVCTRCGSMLPVSPMPMQHAPNYGVKQQVPGAEKKLAAGLCGILIGSFGIHKFILGYQTEGLIYIGMFVAAFALAIITCGIGSFLLFIPSILGIVEGIIYLTKSDEEFVQTYIINKKPWF